MQHSLIAMSQCVGAAPNQEGNPTAPVSAAGALSGMTVFGQGVAEYVFDAGPAHRKRLEGPGRSVTAAWPLQSYLELGALPTAVPCARMHARQVLWEWGMDACAESTELVVSELATNAVRASRAIEQVPPVRLRLSSDQVRVLIEVWDGNQQPPEPAETGETPDLDEETGRGLFLVAAISTEWNWFASPGCVGKVVWAMIDRP